MSPRGGGARTDARERLMEVDESTAGRAGDAATRIAVEETLLRRGWRVLYFDDRFGPLFGPRRSKVIDGIAVRLRPGEEEDLELRLIRFESGTLEIPPALIERVQRVAAMVSTRWIVAAFDGDRLRVLPDPDAHEEAMRAREDDEERARGSRPGGRRGARGDRTDAGAPTPTAARAEAGAAAAAASRAAAPVSPASGSAGASRRPPRRGRGRRDQAAAEPAPPPEAPAPKRARGRGARSRRGAPSPAPPEPPPPPVSGESSGGDARRGRRRGKRGGRRRA